MRKWLQKHKTSSEYATKSLLNPYSLHSELILIHPKDCFAREVLFNCLIISFTFAKPYFVTSISSATIILFNTHAVQVMKRLDKQDESNSTRNKSFTVVELWKFDATSEFSKVLNTLWRYVLWVVYNLLWI